MSVKSRFLWVQGNVFKLRVFSDQQSKTQSYSAYNDLKKRKAPKPHMWEAGTKECFGFFIVNDLNNVSIIKIVLLIN